MVNVLLCFVCRHNRKRTFRTYSLLLTPYSLLLAPYFCGARSAFAFFVAKAANEVTDAGEARVGAELGDSRKEFRTEFSFRERALGET